MSARLSRLLFPCIDTTIANSYGLGLMDQGSGSRVHGAGSRIQGVRFLISGAGFME